ncbi:MAG TPA: sugar phosphate nucleotidyltransferase [Puia sp.]|nr:sugar phosphate nucleotidyltransferase [Puia sp.]
MNTNEVPGITKAMILAAGLGTRFKPWTDKHPKALAPVNGKSLLQRNIEYLQKYGIREVMVNVHHFADQVRTALSSADGWGSKVTISDETGELLETGGGLKKAGWWLEKAPFLMMNVDILTDLDLSALIRDHFLHRPLATLAVTGRSTSRYFLFDEKQELCGWRNIKTGAEKIAKPANIAGPANPALAGPVAAGPAPGAVATGPLIQKAFSGIHVISPGIFPLMHQEGKFSMVDLYLDLAAAGHTIRGFDHSDSKLIDVGKPEAVAEAERMFP